MLFADNFIRIALLMKCTSRFDFAFTFKNFAFNPATGWLKIKQKNLTNFILEIEQFCW